MYVCMYIYHRGIQSVKIGGAARNKIFNPNKYS